MVPCGLNRGLASFHHNQHHLDPLEIELINCFLTILPPSPKNIPLLDLSSSESDTGIETIRQTLYPYPPLFDNTYGSVTNAVYVDACDPARV